MTKVGDKTIGNIECEVHANEHGSWQIVHNGESIGSGTSLDAAVAKARDTLNRRKQKVKVPFITQAGEKGIATGLNSRDRRVLTVMEDGSKPQLSNNEAVFKPDTDPKVIAKFIAKTAEANRLHRELREIMSTHTYRLGDAVNREITNKQPLLARVTAKRAAKHRWN